MPIVHPLLMVSIARRNQVGRIVAATLRAKLDVMTVKIGAFGTCGRPASMLIALEDPPELRLFLLWIDLFPDIGRVSNHEHECRPRGQGPDALAQVLEEAVQVLDDGVRSPEGDSAKVAREVQ